MSKIRRQLIFCSRVLVLTMLCIVPAMSTAIAVEKSLPVPTTKDKCPVCGMFVAKYPDWIAVITFKDGTHTYFDGAKDMFKFLHAPTKYKRARAENIMAISVKDYYSLKWLDARKAWYVIGGDIYGPMGRELIPLRNEDEAREFINDHKGKKILKFTDITPEIIKTLD